MTLVYCNVISVTRVCCFIGNIQSATLEDTDDDALMAKQRLLKQQKKTETESSDTATIKKLHVSSANLQRVSIVIVGLFIRGFFILMRTV